MKVLEVQLGAEGILVGNHPAGVFVGPVTHAGTIRLKIRHLGLVPWASVLRVFLDVDHHAAPVSRQGGPLLGLPSLFLDVHEQPENNQIEKSSDDG